MSLTKILVEHDTVTDSQTTIHTINQQKNQISHILTHNNKTANRKIIQQEEERFQATLAQGIEVLEKYIADLKAESKTVLDGELAFKLYDTFGFPWELTAEILEEQNMSLDKDVFDQKMEEQRTRARAARQENQRLAIPDLKGLQTENLSYNETATESKVVWMWTDGGKGVPTAANAAGAHLFGCPRQ